MKDLAGHLIEIMGSVPYDQTITKQDFYTGLAQRAILESFSSPGYSCECSMQYAKVFPYNYILGFLSFSVSHSTENKLSACCEKKREPACSSANYTSPW